LVIGRDPGADPYALETFINGPRVYIGRNFAILEFKVIVSGYLFSSQSLPQEAEARFILVVLLNLAHKKPLITWERVLTGQR
jgi:cytochrome P450